MQKTIIEEILFAGRGILLLLLGRRDASINFDLSLRGLAGSFAAFLAAAAFSVFMPKLSGAEGTVPAAEALLMVLFLYGIQAGFAAIVLQALGRGDGLVPYLVCDNWATFYVTILSALLVLAGVDGDAALFILGVLVIIIEINIARLIVTLRALQIVGFLVAQMIGVFVGLMIFSALVPSELVDQAASL